MCKGDSVRQFWTTRRSGVDRSATPCEESTHGVEARWRARAMRSAQVASFLPFDDSFFRSFLFFRFSAAIGSLNKGRSWRRQKAKRPEKRALTRRHMTPTCRKAQAIAPARLLSSARFVNHSVRDLFVHFRLVPMVGFEPTMPGKAADPRSAVSTVSTTPATNARGVGRLSRQRVSRPRPDQSTAASCRYGRPIVAPQFLVGIAYSVHTLWIEGMRLPMAKDRKTKEISQKRTVEQAGKPVSLSPLSFEEAVRGLASVKRDSVSGTQKKGRVR